VQPLRALAAPAARHRDRVVAVLRLGGEVALQQAHAATAAQVDRRDDVEASHAGRVRATAPGSWSCGPPAPATVTLTGRVAARTKLPSSLSPACWLFSGWNCVAMRASRATTAVNSSSP